VPPEQPPYLVILDTSFLGEELVGRSEYILQLSDPLSVRWGIGTPPNGYTPEGGGVVFVSHQNPTRSEPDEHAPIQQNGKLTYSYQEGLGAAPWLMLVMILPPDHALAQSNPPPDGSRLFGERLAYYWRLTSPAVEAKFAKVEWKLRPTSNVSKALQGEHESPSPFPFDAREVPEFGVFVSYRKQENKWEVGRIKDWLTLTFGEHAVFRDNDSIQPGRDFREEIDAAVGKCKVMLVIIGSTWLMADPTGKRRIDSETDWVRIEVESALQRHRVVLPILLDDARMPDPTALPESLRQLAFNQAYNVRENTFERDVNGLIQHLRAHLT
jgi:hypothetical protein